MNLLVTERADSCLTAAVGLGVVGVEGVHAVAVKGRGRSLVAAQP